MREVIRKKNELYFYKWRPSNETYLIGFRKHEQGRNAKEVAEFNPLVEAAEAEIEKLLGEKARINHRGTETQRRRNKVDLSSLCLCASVVSLFGYPTCQDSPSFLLAALAVPMSAFGQPNAKVPDPDPELERKTFIVADGFEVNLFAADPLLAKPIQMNFDAAGPALGRVAARSIRRSSRARRPTTRSSSSRTPTATARPTRPPSSPTACSSPPASSPATAGPTSPTAPSWSTSSDTDGDGKADATRVVLSGFGTEDTHHILHTFRWGPDGLLYFNQSIYIHSHVETPHGVKRLNGGGIWQFRPGDDGARRLRPRAGQPLGPPLRPLGPVVRHRRRRRRGDQLRRSRARTYVTAAGGDPASCKGLNPGSPKYCGLEIVSGRHLPDDWQGNIITNDFRGHRVCRFKLRRRRRRLRVAASSPNVIKTNHPAFRPIDVKMGPDGAIYIADWYNPIIQHGEVDFRDPRRDHTHGRIWRVTAKGRPLVDEAEAGRRQDARTCSSS